MKLLKTLKALKNTIMRRFKPNSQRYAIIKDDKIHVNTLNRGIIIVVPYEEVEEFLRGYEFQYKPQYGQEFNVDNYEFIKNLGFWGNDLVGGETTTFVKKEHAIVEKKAVIDKLQEVEAAAEDEVISSLPFLTQPQFCLNYNKDPVFEQYYDYDFNSALKSSESNKPNTNNTSTSSISNDSSVSVGHLDLINIEVVVKKLYEPEYCDLVSLRSIIRSYLDNQFLNSWNMSATSSVYAAV